MSPIYKIFYNMDARYLQSIKETTDGVKVDITDLSFCDLVRHIDLRHVAAH